jgi:hypothetical protein
MQIYNDFGILNNFQEMKLRKRLKSFTDFNKINFWICDFMKEHNIEPCPIRIIQVKGEHVIEFLPRNLQSRRYSI